MICARISQEEVSLIRRHFELNETIVTIIAEKEIHIEAAVDAIKKCRREIEQFIQRDRRFEATLEPYKCPNNAPEIIKRMCRSSEKFNIGPMSTVAGIIAEYAVKAMISKGAKHAIVDNGGDMALVSNRKVNIGLYTGNQYTGQFAFQVPPQDKILGICTSSGKVGHSFSFGSADSVTIFSNDVAVADAAATAFGNLVNSTEDIQRASKILDNVKEIIGATTVIDNKIGFYGKVPQIIQARIPYELITKGW